MLLYLCAGVNISLTSRLDASKDICRFDGCNINKEGQIRDLKQPVSWFPNFIFD